MDATATDVLSKYTLASLQQMARFRGVEFAKKNKEGIVQALAQVIFDPAAIQASLEDLTQLERHVLNRIILGGGETPSALIRQQLEHEDKVERRSTSNRGQYSTYSYYHQEKGSPRNRDSRRFVDIIARLSAHGLVFTADPVYTGGSTVEINQPGHRLYIPLPVLRHLPHVHLAPKTTSPPAFVQESNPAPLLRDFYLLLSFVAQEQVPLTSRGMIPKRSLLRINETLRHAEGNDGISTEDDLGWLPFLRGLAEQHGLLAAGPGELVLDGQAEAFLRQPAAERQQRLFDAYRNSTKWNEIFRIGNVSAKGKGMSVRVAPPGVVAARQRVLAELAALPTGEWIELDHLLERLRISAYEFLFSRHWSPDRNYSYGYYGHGGSQLPNPYHTANSLGLTFEIYDEAAGWGIVETGFIRCIVTEALFALGAVDLGLTDGRATSFRITADGARLLSGETLPARPSQTHVVIQPNFQIFVLEPASEDVLFRLDQLADRKRADQAIEYELTRDSVYRAQRAGLDAPAIVKFLEGVSAVELPQNVRRTIEDWGAQVERITLRRRTPLLQTRNEKSLDLLYADPNLAPFLGRKVAPTAAIVKSADLQPLIDQLQQRHLLPALSEGPEDHPVPLLAAETDGHMVFRQQLPSIYDLLPLRWFADVERDGIRMSQASLRRGAKAGLAADDIVATLEWMCAGSLPVEVTALVRKWAKDWGHGALFDATILQVEQPDTLSDLLGDPELRPSLIPLPGASKLVLVRPRAVERVRSLLADRGMVLHDHLVD